MLIKSSRAKNILAYRSFLCPYKMSAHEVHFFNHAFISFLDHIRLTVPASLHSPPTAFSFKSLFLNKPQRHIRLISIVRHPSTSMSAESPSEAQTRSQCDLVCASAAFWEDAHLNCCRPIVLACFVWPFWAEARFDAGVGISCIVRDSIPLLEFDVVLCPQELTECMSAAL